MVGVYGHHVIIPTCQFCWTSLDKFSYNSETSHAITNSPTARVKDTSGERVSPHTIQARPKPKHALGALGRRLTFNIDSGKGKRKRINLSANKGSCPWQYC